MFIFSISGNTTVMVVKNPANKKKDVFPLITKTFTARIIAIAARPLKIRYTGEISTLVKLLIKPTTTGISIGAVAATDRR